MRMLVFLCLLFSTVVTYSQTITKVLVIDTIVGDASRFKVKVCDRDDTMLPEWTYPKLDTSTFPNLTAMLVGKKEGLVLRLPLDDSGGYLELENLFLFKSDTIRISTLHIFHNCLPDTVKSTIDWYKTTTSDSGTDRVYYASTNKTRVSNTNCVTSYPKSLHITINNKDITTPMELAFVDGMRKTFSGHKIKNVKRFYRRESRGKQVIIFHGELKSRKGILRSSVNLAQ